MVKRRIMLLLCLCFGMCVFTGCAGSVDLTEEQEDVIAEYSAGILMQYDAKYDKKLVMPEGTPMPQPTATPETVEEPTPTPEADESAGSSVPAEETEKLEEVSLKDLYRVMGMQVSYDSYKICKEYPKKSSAVQITADEGKSLLVLKFKVKNTTSRTLKIDLIDRQIEYPIDLDGTIYDPTIAAQKNGGMNYLKTNLKPHSTETALLIYNIPDTAKNPESAVLTVKDGESAATIKVK